MTQFIRLFTYFLRGTGSSPPKHLLLTLASLLLLSACSDVKTGSISGALIFPGQTEGLASASNSRLTEDAVIPGEVIVKFASDVQVQSLSVQGHTLKRAQAAGLPRTALYHAEGLDEAGTLALAESLNARPDVLYAEPNALRTIQKTPNDEYYPYQWHYGAMNLPAAWDISDGTQREVVVAVVDSGVVAHPDLQGVSLGGYDFVLDPASSGDGDGYDPDPTDTDSGEAADYHGTHVAGTVAASTNNGSGVAGVSWGAGVLNVRVIGTRGGTVFDMVNGVLWAAGERVSDVPSNPNPAQVINISLGGEGACTRFEQDAFDRVRSRGVNVVVAAGNSGDNASRYAPASCKDVITVGATGPQGERAPYSNYGAVVDVMAPGGDFAQDVTFDGLALPAGVLSTVGNGSGGYTYNLYQGTSMAAPHVSGLIALMLAQESLSPDAILERLKGSAYALSASECGRPSGSDCGAGSVDAAATLKGSGSSGFPGGAETGRVTTYVRANYCAASCAEYDVRRSKTAKLSTVDKLELPYTLNGLESGTYVVEAWQDVDADGQPSSGELSGQSTVTLRAGEALRRVDIDLESSANFEVLRSSGFKQTIEEVIGLR